MQGVAERALQPAAIHAVIRLQVSIYVFIVIITKVSLTGRLGLHTAVDFFGLSFSSKPKIHAPYSPMPTYQNITLRKPMNLFTIGPDVHVLTHKDFDYRHLKSQRARSIPAFEIWLRASAKPSPKKLNIFAVEVPVTFSTFIPFTKCSKSPTPPDAIIGI